MKRFQIVTTLLLLAMVVWSAPVSVERAKNVANIVLSKTDNQLIRRAHKVEGAQLKQADITGKYSYLYIFSDEVESVIISGDDCAHPVLAYLDRSLPDVQELPDNIRNWLEGYNREIEWAVENKISSSANIQKEWDILSAGASVAGSVVIAPLVESQWDQGSPYNLYTPKHYPTGCVATAMAQIMRYWSFPEKGIGSHSYRSAGQELTADFANTIYDWENMPLTLTSASTEEERQAVSTLMFHCGVATEMSYSSVGSGTYVIENYSERGYDCAEYALKNYFGYKMTMHGELRDWKTDEEGYTDEEWKSLLKEDLQQGRPVLYSGYGEEGGHAFVCDGYRDDDYFHFNWGWGGYYDGYFRLNALNPEGVGIGGGSGGFNTMQHAIFGVEPDIFEQLTPNRYDLQMGTRMSISVSQMDFSKTAGAKITISGLLKNYGENDYMGSLCMFFSDGTGNVLDTIQLESRTILSATRTVISTSYTFKELLMPDIYSFSLAYFDAGNMSFVPVGADYFAPIATMDVHYESDEIDVVSSIEYETPSVYTGEELILTTDVSNISTKTFSGNVRFLLVSLDMTQVVQMLEENDATEGLVSGDTVAVVCSDVITAPVGEYILALQYQKGKIWMLAGSREHYNPIRVKVEEKPEEEEKEEEIDAVDNLRQMVHIYPNPATDVLFVGLESAAELRLTDMSGRMVKSGCYGAGDVCLQVGDLPAGVYLLQLNSDKGTAYERIIKE